MMFKSRGSRAPAEGTITSAAKRATSEKRKPNMIFRVPDRRNLALLCLPILAVFSAGCGASDTTDTSVSEAVSVTMEQIRVDQGQPWGVEIPGLAAAVRLGPQAQRRSFRLVSGVADPPRETPLVDDDRFHVGSITKTFTAALIMQLDQSGRLSLDDTIDTWFDYPGGDGVTVEMLLGHTSGLPDFSDMPGHRRTATPRESIALAATGQPLFEPGTQWSYSNTNYILLGLIAEEVTGRTWEEELQVRFFEPLALEDTYIWTGDAMPPTADGSRMQCGEKDEPTCVPRPGFAIVPVTDGFDWTVAWSAGAIVSTPADIATWLDALVAGDVLDAQHRELMTTPTPQSEIALAELPPFGNLTWSAASLGLFRYDIAGVGFGWGHEGNINGFVSNAVHMAESGDTVVVASNFLQTDAFAALGDLVAAVEGATASARR
jgi:D-alanyl-D-alanine carboxypeptidase